MSVYLNLWRRLTVVAVTLAALTGFAVASAQRAPAQPSSYSCGDTCYRTTNNGGSGGGTVTVMNTWCGVNHGSNPCPGAQYVSITPGQTVANTMAFAIAGNCSGYVTWYRFNADDGYWHSVNSYPIDRHGRDALWTRINYGYWARVSQTCG